MMGHFGMKWISLEIFIIGLTSNIRAESIDNARALTSDLMANYSRILKPKRNQSEPVDVSIGFQLLSILEFDEVQEKLSLIAITYLIWTDELITWKPEDYGGIEAVYFESHQVWTPMLVLVNTVNDIKKLGFDDDWLLVRYYHNGSAYFYPGGVLAAKCDADVTYFPWDEHKCRFQFSTWGTDQNFMNTSQISDEVLLEYYSPNGAWDLISTQVLTKYQNALFEMYITLARKPRFVIINVILPIVMMAIISTIVFYIPIDSGERISYSITMLLAIAVFLTLVGDNLPKTSNPMSIFSYYLLSMLILNILITLTNIFSVKCFYIGDKQPVGACWASFGRCFKCKKRDTKKRLYVENRNGNVVSKSNSTADSKQHQHRVSSIPAYSTEISLHSYNRRPYLNGANSNIKYMMSNPDRLRYKGYDDRDVDSDKEIEDDSVTWEEVSAAIDIVAQIVSILAIVSLTLVFFLYIWLGGTRDS